MTLKGQGKSFRCAQSGLLLLGIGMLTLVASMASIIREAPAKWFTDKLSLQTAVQAHLAEQ
jgi:hypothetical protein